MTGTRTTHRTYYTPHGGCPTTDAEWAAHNFRVGRYYAGHGIMLDELKEEWPEVFNNPDCMRGYFKGCEGWRT